MRYWLPFNCIVPSVSPFVTAFCEAYNVITQPSQKLHMPFYNSINRPWDITTDQVSGGSPSLRIGHRRVQVTNIQGISRVATQERDFLGSLLNYSAYLIIAAIFMVLVVQAGWRERFLLATIFFAIVGATSLIDIGLSNRIRLYRLSITTRDGKILEFTTANASEADQLLATLNSLINARTV